MPNNSSGGVGGMIDGLKSRLGLSRDDDRYDDRYDDYGDGYDDDGYDDYEDEYDEGYRSYGSDYDSNDSSVGGFRPVEVSSSRSSRSSRDLSSNLVSIDDVKASTRVPERLNRDPLADSGSSYSSRTSSRSTADYSGPAGTVTTRETSYSDSRSRSEGLNSLFEPSGSGAYDPYEAYSSSTPGTYSSSRSLSVIKPVVYGDVERVARAVKSGDVVVLAMRNTPDDLSKRILDFSFGVASALEANVECPGAKVFAIARGNGLTEAEKLSLRSQGVL